VFAAMAALKERLVARKRAKPSPLRITDIQRCLALFRSPEMRAQRFTNLIQVHKFVSWIVHRCGITSENCVSQRIGDVRGRTLSKLFSRVDPLSPSVLRYVAVRIRDQDANVPAANLDHVGLRKNVSVPATVWRNAHNRPRIGERVRLMRLHLRGQE
jgi:hypothetical protein